MGALPLSTSCNIEGVHKTDDFGTTVSVSKEPAITGILRVLGKKGFWDRQESVKTDWKRQSAGLSLEN